MPHFGQSRLLVDDPKSDVNCCRELASKLDVAVSPLSPAEYVADDGTALCLSGTRRSGRENTKRSLAQPQQDLPWGSSLFQPPGQALKPRPDCQEPAVEPLERCEYDQIPGGEAKRA